MKYELKKLEKSTVQITIEVSPEEIKKHKEKAAEDISKEMKIPGFRPGHVPLDVLEKHVDKKHILAHTYELAVQYSYAEAATKEKLKVVAQPKIKFISDTTKDGEPLKFEAEVAVMPETKIKDYKSIKIPKEDAEVTKKEVDETIEDLKKHFTEWKDADRAVKKGDRVEVDFEGFEPEKGGKDGKPGDPIPNTKSQNHPIVIGDNIMVPGFEDELIGLKKDEKKEFELKFPESYHKKDFQNKKVLFKIEVKRIEEGTKPELNEELTEKITGQKLKVEDFKKDVEKNIKAQKEQKAKQERENKYLEELLKRTEMEIPESLIEQEIDFILEDMGQDLAQKGIPFDKFLEQTGTKIEDLRKKYEKEAEKRVKIRLALTHVIEEEKIEVTEEDLTAEIDKITDFYPEDQRGKIKEDLLKGYEKLRMKNKLLLTKFFSKVLE